MLTVLREQSERLHVESGAGVLVHEVVVCMYAKDFVDPRCRCRSHRHQVALWTTLSAQLARRICLEPYASMSYHDVEMFVLCSKRVFHRPYTMAHTQISSFSGCTVRR